jgi:hypothetical protein
MGCLAGAVTTLLTDGVLNNAGQDISATVRKIGSELLANERLQLLNDRFECCVLHRVEQHLDEFTVRRVACERRHFSSEFSLRPEWNQREILRTQANSFVILLAPFANIQQMV